MKNLSIKKKLLVVVFSLIIGFMASLLLLNKLFLEEFYIYTLKNDFIKEANSVSDIQSTDQNKMLEYLKERNNLKGYKYIIVELDGKITHSSVPEFNKESRLVLGKDQLKVINESKDEIKNRGYKYIVLDHINDDKDQIIIIKDLGSEKTLVISVQIDGIRNSANVANSFFILSGSFILLIILLISYVLSKKIVSPIIDINKETTKIAQMDFDVSLNYTHNDEIGELSHNISFIANSLDQKIKELNTANDLLEKDMIHQRQFLASLAHEFKSPVGIIKGYAESVKLNYYKDEREKTEYIDYILEESDILNSIVEDIVLLAKLDKRDFKLDISEFDMSNQMKRSLVKYKKLIDDNSLKLDSFIEADLKINADSMRIEQIINNILSNTVRYTSLDGTIKIALKSVNGIVELVVSNTSSIISKNEINSMLKPFYRLDESRSRETGGHGLGLAIVGALVKAHNFKIALDYIDNEFLIKIVFDNKNNDVI